MKVVIKESTFEVRAREVYPGLDSSAALEQLTCDMLYHVCEMKMSAGFSVPQQVRFVPGGSMDGRSGPRQSDIMVIGKAPTAQDSYTGRLMSGPGGTLFRGLLTKLGIDYTNWYLSTVCKFILPAKQKAIKVVWKNESKLLLDKELAIVQPKFILLLGSDAIKSFFGAQSTIEKYRGSAHAWNNCQVVCSAWPNSCIASPEEIPALESDLAIFVRLVTGQGASEPIESRCYLYIEDAEELSRVVDILISSNCLEFAVDCEWGAKDGVDILRTINISWGQKMAMVIVLKHAEDVINEKMDINLCRQQLQRLFCRPEVAVSGHSFRSDMKQLLAFGLDLSKQFVFDTMLVHHLLHETEAQKLELVGLKYCNMGRYDMPLTQWKSKHNELVKAHAYGDVPDEILLPYAACDADLTFRLMKLLKVELAKFPALESLYYNIVHPCNFPILEMETYGMAVDRTRMEAMINKVQLRCDEMKTELQTVVGWPDFNPSSYRNSRELLFGIDVGSKIEKLAPAGAKTFHFTPIKSTGKPSRRWTDVVERHQESEYSPAADSMTLMILKYQNPNEPILDMFHKFKVLDQLKKNFLRPMEYADADESGVGVWDGGLHKHLRADNRIRTSFRQTLETGRFATSPNMQNLPNKQEPIIKSCFTKAGVLDADYNSCRSLFVASPGCILIEADFKQAELFVLAHYAEEDEMIAILNNPKRDIHLENAIKMFNIHPDVSTAELLEEAKKKYKRERIVGKSCSFGLPYGRGANALVLQVLAEGVVCDEATAQGWINTFFKANPKVHAYLESCKAAVYNPGYLDTVYGRRRRFFKSSDRGVMKAQEREALNFRIQGTVADAMSRALCNFYYYKNILLRNLSLYHLVNCVHDSVILEVPIQFAKQVINEVIPWCMTTNNVIPQHNYSLAADIGLYCRMGVTPKQSELRVLGLDEELVSIFGKKE